MWKYPRFPVADVTVNVTDVQQTMDGFGASDHQAIDLDSTLADLFFSQSAGIGLSFLRTSMNEDGTGTDAIDLTLVAARGARIWMYSLSAPAAWKDNGSLTNGGHLLAGHYDDWATMLAGYQATVQASASVNLYAVSVQNEPDISATYRSMLFTTAEMTAFVKVLGPKLAALSPAPRLLLAEPANAALEAGFVSAIQADGTAAPYLDICAWHQYSGATSPTASHTNWQTEMSYFSAFDPTMTNALAMAADIHTALTTGNVSAWHYYELVNGGNSDNEGLIGNGSGGGTDTTLTKRLYALGNYSKFVRPGYVRVGTTGTMSGVSWTAYVSAGQCVVVAINANAFSVTKNVGLVSLGVAASTMTPWITDVARDLVAQAAVPVINNVFTMALPALSVSTFVSA